MFWIGVSKTYGNIFRYGSIQNNEKGQQFNEDKDVQCVVTVNSYAAFTVD